MAGDLEARGIKKERDGRDGAEGGNFRPASGDYSPIDGIASHRRNRPPKAELA
jgi:hypothetical protein